MLNRIPDVARDRGDFVEVVLSEKLCQLQQLRAPETPSPRFLFMQALPGQNLLICESENNKRKTGQLHVFQLLGSSAGEG